MLCLQISSELGNSKGKAEVMNTKVEEISCLLREITTFSVISLAMLLLEPPAEV